MSDDSCKSCGQSFSGNFCSHCGEKSANKRLTIKDLFGDFMSNLLALEFPLLNTIKGLTIRPGIMCREYVEGKRKPYYKPFQYYLLTLAVLYLFFYASGLQMSDYVTKMEPTFSGGLLGEEQQIMMNEITALVEKYSRLILFTMIVITSIYTRLMFRKSGYNLTENFVMNLYVNAHAAWVTLLGIPLSFIDFNLYALVTSIVLFVYQFWTYRQFYQMSFIATLVRGVSVWILATITLGIVNLIVTISYLQIFGTFTTQ